MQVSDEAFDAQVLEIKNNKNAVGFWNFTTKKKYATRAVRFYLEEYDSVWDMILNNDTCYALGTIASGFMKDLNLLKKHRNEAQSFLDLNDDEKGKYELKTTKQLLNIFFTNNNTLNKIIKFRKSGWFSEYKNLSKLKFDSENQILFDDNTIANMINKVKLYKKNKNNNNNSDNDVSEYEVENENVVNETLEWTNTFTSSQNELENSGNILKNHIKKIEVDKFVSEIIEEDKEIKENNLNDSKKDKDNDIIMYEDNSINEFDNLLELMNINGFNNELGLENLSNQFLKMKDPLKIEINCNENKKRAINDANDVLKFRLQEFIKLSNSNISCIFREYLFCYQVWYAKFYNILCNYNDQRINLSEKKNDINENDVNINALENIIYKNIENRRLVVNYFFQNIIMCGYIYNFLELFKNDNLFFTDTNHISLLNVLYFVLNPEENNNNNFVADDFFYNNFTDLLVENIQILMKDGVIDINGSQLKDWDMKKLGHLCVNRKPITVLTKWRIICQNRQKHLQSKLTPKSNNNKILKRRRKRNRIEVDEELKITDEIPFSSCNDNSNNNLSNELSKLKQRVDRMDRNTGVSLPNLNEQPNVILQKLRTDQLTVPLIEKNQAKEAAKMTLKLLKNEFAKDENLIITNILTRNITNNFKDTSSNADLVQQIEGIF
ncbi:MAG: hypothetical protein GY755_23575 [Chloroflexi bacterium]|nr:hypothetical protein [Chloroflexota bacterium]